MGSQTLEILRNCLSCFTGGIIFFDPHQTIFCNAVHLYVWLFLLCMPFISYLYFTTTHITWGIYCISVAILMAVLKIINFALHSMYDKAQAMSDVNLKKSSRGLRETSGDEDAGIEMQVLGSSDMPSRLSVERQSDEVSCGNSAISIDYLEPSSTIDFKVDVHRKNSSESSDSVGIYPKTALQTSIVTHCAEVCPTSSHRRNIKSEVSGIEGAESKEISSRNLEKETDSNNDEAAPSRKPTITRQNRHESLEKEDKKRSQHGKLQRQISLDSEQMAITESSSKLQRHRSSDCHEDRQKNKSNVSLTIPHHHQLHNHSRLQSLENYTTKSELAIENIPSETSKSYLMQKSTPMRRDSNSTMSALQLPTASTSSSSSRVRRHSNTGGKGMSGSTSVRRIKSAALETCCPQQSVSNLTPHPNSIEVISGQALRNPQHTVLPLPSKCLSRNPHLNLFPKSSGTLNNVDPVYPIEEQADEGASGRSLNEEFTLNQASESDEDEDEDSRETHSAANQRQSITESESDIERPQTQSTDSDTENNGSRSPLLEVRNRISGVFISDKPVIISDKKTKSIDSDKSKTENCDKKSEESEGGISSDCEQASAGSKDMLLTDKEVPQYITLDLNIFKEENAAPFSIFKEDSNVTLDVPIRNLGAIPKSRTRSNSSRRFSAEDHCRPSRNIALPRRAVGSHLPQTPTAPVLTFLNARSEHPILPIYPSPSTASEFHFQSIYRFRPRAYAVVEPNRHRQPKIRRSTRSKHHQRSSLDGGNTSKEDPTELTPPMQSLGSFEKIINRPIDNSLSLERFMEEAYGYDIASTERSAQRTAILNIGRVEFNETIFPDFGRPYISTEKPVQPKRYYRFPLRFFGKKDIKISMDRLQLLALFDRDSGWIQVILAIILTILVSILGSIVLQKGFYDDIFAFIFCFVIAGCQYSLLKSVQPDAASPIHGFNKTVAYSRPIYFCLCSSLLLLGHHFGHTTNENDYRITIFGISYIQTSFFKTIQHILSIVLLLFPIFFSLGLFPQINTFLIYFLEQIDMHVFGGNAVSSLLAAFISISRSIIACLVLYGPAFGGLSEPRGTQHVLFSIFCALLIPVSYHLSRSASDFSCIWNLIKSSLIFHPDDDDEEDENERSKETKSDTDERKEGSSNEINEKKNEEEIPEVTTTTAQEQIIESELIDPLPKKLQSTVNTRLKNDLLICSVLGVIVMSLHSSTIFTVLQPDLNFVLYLIAMVLGLLLHYIIPQMRKHLPWLCLARPLLRQNEHGQFEAKDASAIMWFESTYICLCFLERNVLYPLVFLSALTADSATIAQKFGVHFGAAIVVICGLKCIRSSYSDPSSQYLILTFSFLYFRLDYKSASETFLIDYFIVAIIFKKTCEFLLKMQFVVTYIAPWQITWGSAFHAFAQPFSVPHSAMLFLQAAISAILSTPLNPFLGSAIFLTSYVRPIKFWERDYNTKRIDHSNTRLSSQLERDLGADDNNLNSIFYEHLTRSLQHSLCGDLLLGRWGNVSQGDCFVLASDYLNCLVHIIELGNGLCTFQMRGLEFRGTYCQQREVEAISEGVEDNDGCCCCSPGHLPRMLSANAMFSTRWLAWQVVAAKYVLEGYSISDNSAIATLQVFEFRKVLITYYVKSIIYYIIRSPKLNDWLISRPIQDALLPTLDRQFVDLDPIFNHNLDDDYDFRSSGVTRNSFCTVYLDWIQFCCIKRQNQNTAPVTATSPSSPRSSSNPTPSPRDGNPTIRMRPTKNNNSNNSTEEQQQAQQSNSSTINMARESPLVSLCLSLALLARRTLATASHSSSTGVEFFLHGLHALFKGDFRITSPRDEWVFADMELLHGVVAPAVRMSLKLHQDHFLCPEEYEDPVALYDAIGAHSQELVISHEADPLWRNAVLRGAPNLLALRHVMEDGSDEYRVIRLTKRYLSFRVIKLNRECVRGLWAGQQQELIYLRNRNPERGSIQNAKQALRNIINSSCDQPIGYPIYVSPLTTSYAETNEQLCSIIGGAITLEMLHKMIIEFWNRVRQRCREGCSSGSALEGDLGEIQGVYSSAQTPNNTLSGTTGTLSYGSQNISITGAGLRGSLSSFAKPSSSTLIAGLLNRERDIESRLESFRDRGISRRHTSRSERERRATLPGSNRETSKENMGSTNSSLKLQESIESCNVTSVSPNQKSNNSSSINLSLANNNNNNNNNACSTNNNKKLLTGSSGSSCDRKSFERTPSNKDDYDEPPLVMAPPPPNIVLNRQVFIYDVGEIYDCLDLGRRIDVIWPNEQMRAAGGRSSWKDWTPVQGMIGYIVHYWQPNHSDCHFRSNVNRTILLVQIGERYVPIGEKGVREFTISDIDENFTSTNIPEVQDEEETEVENHCKNNGDDKTNIDDTENEMDEPKVCDENMMWSNEYYAYVVYEK